MSETKQPIADNERIQKLRNRLAASLGVSGERKEAIYIEISESVTLRDPSYWLQILFSSGIATLGLVLNSPAVIIGAMLISPLMGPILANGLALASGDLILGTRALVNVALSCLVATTFSFVLVALLPFKEITSEILARTEPNTLDLVIALFSGAIGAVAICREAKGVATSIPGVAIAVALMPPLSVAGYGLGLAATFERAEGMRIARGGSLLFLTNFVAITFTAMIVFLSLHIDTLAVRRQVRRWRRENDVGTWVKRLTYRMPGSERVRKIGGLPGRLLLILLVLSLISIPLSESFSRLKRQVSEKQQENNIRKVATTIWQQNFAKLEKGEPRSYIGQLSTSNQDGKLAVSLRIFTSKPLTQSERADYTRLLARGLGRPEASLAVQLLEIPTASSEIVARKEEQQQAPTFAQLQASLAHTVESSVQSLRVPPPAEIFDYQLIEAAAGEPPSLKLKYLSDRDIDPDAQTLIAEDLRSRLGYPAAEVSFERTESSFDPLAFGRNQSSLNGAKATVDRLGQLLREEPALILEIATGARKGEREGIGKERSDTVTEYLVSKWQVAQERIVIAPATAADAADLLRLKRAELGR